MNILILIVVAVVGIALGAYFTSRKSVDGLISEQSKKKAENKEQILEFLRNNKKVTNNNVEKLVKVSHATAERYLDELEKEGKLTQHGKIGQNVFYTLK
ncbi:MAG: DUF977 family protein [Parcubacteria group bacterium]|nr:DUF977 family protein [Parcubacteria group bacterium]